MAADLKDKVVIATGGASGIGGALVELAYSQGAQIVAIDVQKDLLAILEERLSSTAGGTISTAVVDVTDSSAVVEAVSEVVSRYGRIDGLFNNAGVTHDMISTPEMPDEEFDRVMKINSYGAFYFLKNVLRVMRDQRSGAIVNTASTAGEAGLGNFVPYVASKHAVVGMTKAAALEAAAYGVRVNAVLPGYIHTPIYDAYDEKLFDNDPAKIQAAKDEWAKNVPLGRFGRPEEIATVTAFLLSDDASFLSGASIRVDGSQLAGFYDGVNVDNNK